jgi:hypothetical protein
VLPIAVKGGLPVPDIRWDGDQYVERRVPFPLVVEVGQLSAQAPVDEKFKGGNLRTGVVH